jgi:hypothetical protein
VAAKPIPGYPIELRHIGDHLLRRRLKLGLQQTAAARMIGTGAWNLRNWETGRHGVETRFLPAVIRFLGYCPLPVPRNRGDAVCRERMSRGWSRKRLARVARVDEATIRRIEENTSRLARRPLIAVLGALNIDSQVLKAPDVS